MRRVALIGVPFNSAGRSDGVARAPAALREAGLARVLRNVVELRDLGGVDVGAPKPERSYVSGLLAEEALVTMIENVREDVAEAHGKDEFPLVLGGDCPVVLGALAASRDRYGEIGLFMVDGHEDAYPPQQSATGEAADSELFIALGIDTERLPEAIRVTLPLLEARQVSLLGARDEATLAREAVPSLRGTVPMYNDVEIAARGATAVARQAADEISGKAQAWWLHTDLDVLSTDELAAVDYRQAGGLTWQQLNEITREALSTPQCVGWTLAIYNPDLDPDKAGAALIVEYVAGALASLP